MMSRLARSQPTLSTITLHPLMCTRVNKNRFFMGCKARFCSSTSNPRHSHLRIQCILNTSIAFLSLPYPESPQAVILASNSTISFGIYRRLALEGEARCHRRPSISFKESHQLRFRMMKFVSVEKGCQAFKFHPFNIKGAFVG